ncbi:hypothetical protein MNEG_1712 [Monoraphidium neglectum]|jgi:hypothetical protein|uniref:Uncharacterized protein n=1 Tax=Monoraphidium neglectum TaxID=145388 RepID=A0A0D2NPA9_9CHLO|nr:hypothetical protein MNEG_1712 [Monoraphidium neglectum]KIZ06251.1 hypothetical protein MNEG_1712 [Monoraphidium neglectum]|eukprot:XP_013905270.1 hypothetical protein MNEG_1712 [Monoraphidium neglectum]
MNRTIQNYQKAYRKKVEGLKTELTSTRADNSQLRTQVRRLRRRKIAHPPSLLVGAAVGVLAADVIKSVVKTIKQRLRRGGGGGDKDEGATVPALPAPAAPATEEERAAAAAGAAAAVVAAAAAAAGKQEDEGGDE